MRAQQEILVKVQQMMLIQGLRHQCEPLLIRIVGLALRMLQASYVYGLKRVPLDSEVVATIMQVVVVVVPFR